MSETLKVPADHSVRTHSKISPSKLKALELSPLFEADENQEIHPVTALGTIGHEALDSGNTEHLDEQMEKLVAVCKTYTDALGWGMTEHREVKLDILDGIWGFADLIFSSHEERSAHLVDFKFSFAAQDDAEVNAAAQAYVYGMFRKWNNLEQVEVHYLYPRRDEVSRAVYTRKDIPRILLRLRTIIERAKTATKCNPTVDTCTYCRKRATCKDLAAVALPVLSKYAAYKCIDLELVEHLPGEVSSPAVMAKYLRAAKVMEAWVESVKKHARDMREQNGIDIPGFEWRERQGARKINNPALAMVEAEKLGVSEGQFMACVEVSAAQLIKAAGIPAPKGQKAKAERFMENALRDAGLLMQGPSTYYLAETK